MPPKVASSRRARTPGTPGTQVMPVMPETTTSTNPDKRGTSYNDPEKRKTKSTSMFSTLLAKIKGLKSMAKTKKGSKASQATAAATATPITITPEEQLKIKVIEATVKRLERETLSQAHQDGNVGNVSDNGDNGDNFFTNLVSTFETEINKIMSHATHTAELQKQETEAEAMRETVTESVNTYIPKPTSRPLEEIKREVLNELNEVLQSLVSNLKSGKKEELKFEILDGTYSIGLNEGLIASFLGFAGIKTKIKYSSFNDFYNQLVPLTQSAIKSCWLISGGCNEDMVDAIKGFKKLKENDKKDNIIRAATALKRVLYLFLLDEKGRKRKYLDGTKNGTTDIPQELERLLNKVEGGKRRRSGKPRKSAKSAKPAKPAKPVRAHKAPIRKRKSI